eukprot:NODE_22276_length_714_cov_8.201022.p4 GENE.NODE_22276_length_714_cov_8.201022~~NODE_22276_length_714_cov_8.201022.p4  ORF type:complete len:68 (+),score=23.48 NODE_22276_length_714_cov_8.201022:480-683(+)
MWQQVVLSLHAVVHWPAQRIQQRSGSAHEKKKKKKKKNRKKKPCLLKKLQYTTEQTNHLSTSSTNIT